MGGPSQSAVNTQNSITQQQIGIEQQSLNQSTEDRESRKALQQPAIDFNSALASGDPAAVMKALAPQLTGLSQARSTARENIFEGLAPGAARDVSLAQNDVSNANAVAGLRASQSLGAMDKLANIGSGLGSFSLQELGAGISAGTAASGSNKAVMDSQEAAKASTLGFLGTLAGAGGNIAAARMKGCWIAESIYGVDDVRTHVVREYLNGSFKRRWYGRLIMRAYLRFGVRVAAFLDRHAWLKPAVKPAFDFALWRAVKEHEEDAWARS